MVTATRTLETIITDRQDSRVVRIISRQLELTMTKYRVC